MKYTTKLARPPTASVTEDGSRVETNNKQMLYGVQTEFEFFHERYEYVPYVNAREPLWLFLRNGTRRVVDVLLLCKRVCTRRINNLVRYRDTVVVKIRLRAPLY
jgi:hypothetical protein|uniref:Uncharacterized protein n=1 Tax=Sipha flava TaxID=143950 RepID=A0A2S2QXC7_9HEMI